MKRLIILTASLLASASRLWAGDQCTSANSQAVAYAFESLTVSTTALPFTVATYTPASTGIRPIEATVTIATANVRIRLDGAAPTSTVGHLYLAGQSFVVCAPTIPLFRTIRDTGSAVDAVLTISYAVQQ